MSTKIAFSNCDCSGVAHSQDCAAMRTDPGIVWRTNAPGPVLTVHTPYNKRLTKEQAETLARIAKELETP